MAKRPKGGTKRRKSVFVSYAHKNKRWLDELRKFLKPWLRHERLDLWHDRRIKAGEPWKRDIQVALAEAEVAVLLVTQDFLDSDFIAKEELPRILKRQAKGELRILWIAVSSATVKASPLAGLQAVNDPAKPLDSMRKPQRDKAMVKIADTIADAVTLGSVAAAFSTLDSTTEPMEAAVENRPERRGRRFGIQARYEPIGERIAFTGKMETITADDLKKLPDEDREFIEDLHDSMRHSYRDWVKARKKGAKGKKLRKLEKAICGDLNDILGFLSKMHKYELEDHYSRYRYLCDKLG